MDVEKAEGEFLGEWVRFSRVWATHRFTDEEVEVLLSGKSVTVDGTDGKGRPCKASGRLKKQEWKGRTYWGFVPLRWQSRRPIPDVWAAHTFTDAEKEKLQAGGVVEVKDAKAKIGSRRFSCSVRWTEKEGIIPSFDEEF